MAQRDEGTRNRILDAAGAIFAEQGFDKATIRDISARAEVNLAAVNYHFGDKEGLYRATIRHAHQIVAVQQPIPQWGPETTAEQKLRDFIQTMLQRMLLMQRLAWESRLMMREFIQPTGACQELVEEYIRPHFQILLEILSDLLPPETPTHRRYQFAFSIVGQCLFYKMNDPVIEMLVPEDDFQQFYTPARLAEHIADVSLAALGRQSLFSEESPAAGLTGRSDAIS